MCGDCFLAHELSHKADALKASPSICKDKAAGLVVMTTYSKTTGAVELWKTEAKAYAASLDCVSNLLYNKPNDSDCCQGTLVYLYKYWSGLYDLYNKLAGGAK
jgi:hypothetical protein